jgi:IS30 family transposase
MALEPYKDKAFLYEMYVKRRMNLTDICKHLKNSYNIEVSPQAIYNWVKKYDLLKFRGKGRNLSATSMRRPESPAQKAAAQRKRELQRRTKEKRKAIRGK